MKAFMDIHNILVGVLLLLLVVFFIIMFSESGEQYIYRILGIASGAKYLLLQALGVGMGGVLVSLQALASHRRALAMEKAANAQARATEEQAKANRNVEQGQRQERLKNAIEHLGHMSSSVRLGGASELFQLAQDTPVLRQTILNILCAHVRQITSEDIYREKYRSKPSGEIQSLLLLLFVQDHEIFKGFQPDLQGSFLNGADLRNAHLEKANLEGVLLIGANLLHVNLQGATLLNANLRGSLAPEADLSGAKLIGSNLQKTLLHKSLLRGAIIIAAKMHLADLREVQLQGAVIEGAQLQNTRLAGAELRGIRKTGVKGDGEGISLKFEDNIRASIGKENDLSGVVFAGGLSQEDADSLVKGLPKDETMKLKTSLLPHINKPENHKLPDESGVVTGSYTIEEAEKWIAQYQSIDEASTHNYQV